MQSETLLGEEDEGFVQLLELRDVVFDLRAVKEIAKGKLSVNNDVEYLSSSQLMLRTCL